MRLFQKIAPIPADTSIFISFNSEWNVKAEADEMSPSDGWCSQEMWGEVSLYPVVAVELRLKGLEIF